MIEGVLDLEDAVVQKPLFLVRCKVEQELQLLRARLRHLSLSQCVLAGLDGEDVKCEDDLVLSESISKGAFNLRAASIGGSLVCMNTTLENESGMALDAGDSGCKGDMFLCNGFSAKGEISLVAASIGKNLDCGNATFENEGGRALNVNTLDCRRNVFLRNGFSAKGEISLVAASIGGWLVLTDANLDGTLDMEDAAVAMYSDDQKSRPTSGDLILNGFTYENLTNADLETRLQWLKRASTDPFSPQPYSMLAKVLRDQGSERASTKVLIARSQALVDHRCSWQKNRQSPVRLHL